MRIRLSTEMATTMDVRSQTKRGRVSNRDSVRNVSEVSLVVPGVSGSESKCQSEASWSDPESAATKSRLQ